MARQSLGPLHGVEVMDRDVARLTSSPLDHELLEASKGLAGGPHLLQRSDSAVPQLKDRLHREGLAEHRLGSTDASATTEIVERVGRTQTSGVVVGLRKAFGTGTRRRDDAPLTQGHRDIVG